MSMDSSSTAPLKEINLPDEIYVLDKSVTRSITLAAIFFFFCGLFFNFPLRSFIEHKLISTLATIPNCPLSYKSLDVTYLFPGAYLKSVTLPGVCTGTSTDLRFEEIGVHLVGPSFLPPGLRIRLKARTVTKEIPLYYSLSWGKGVLKIPSLDITQGLLSEMMGKAPIKGTIKLEGLVELTGSNISKLDIALESETFGLYSMNIQNFLVPDLNFGKMTFIAKSNDGKTLNLESFMLGNDNSPVQLKARGKMYINQRMLDNSTLDLMGDVRFKKSFLDQFSILNLLLASKQNINGAYKFNVKGPLSSPVPGLL